MYTKKQLKEHLQSPAFYLNIVFLTFKQFLDEIFYENVTLPLEGELKNDDVNKLLLHFINLRGKRIRT